MYVPTVLWKITAREWNQKNWLLFWKKNWQNLSDDEQQIYIDQWIEIWLKWIENFCDKEKMELIQNESNLELIWTEEKYKNPCKNYNIPYYLAYIYYFYNNDPITSSNFYKISSANDNSLEWSKIMAAIMQWKWWNREKSFFMFLNMAKFVGSKNEACLSFASELEQIWAWYFISKNILLNWELMKSIWETRNELFWDLVNVEDEKDPLYDTQCATYVNKATRELNLNFIENWNKKFIDENWKTAQTAEQLFEEWYIDYLPIDFQQYEKHWIIYKYNKELNNFDYEITNHWVLDWYNEYFEDGKDWNWKG